ncbi:MAG TPA: YceI family protein [Candidatus Acidoferrales bacterium]|nr:YceI family protein [Candidatus Acidoferrales bacterium]
MRNIFARFLLTAALLIFFATVATAEAVPWQIDPAHSAAQFAVRHMMVSTVRGAFSKVSGVVNYDEKNSANSSVEVTVDVSSVDTRVPQRDADLRSGRFFDVTKYPTMTFRSKRITPSGDGRFKMTGDLTIHGVTREVTFDVEGPTPAVKDPQGHLRRGASATTKINRKEFGIAYNAVLEGGGLVVGDEVAISIDVELVRPAAPAPGSNN